MLFEISSGIHERRYQPGGSSGRKFLTRKKFLGEKTGMKNFSNALVVLVTTIPAQKAKPE